MSPANILWILGLHLSLISALALPDDVAFSSNYNNSYEEMDEAVNGTNKLRDKRALGLILSGLAQVFGYTLSPVQLAVLPNENPAGAATNQPAQAPAFASPASQTPPAGRQRPPASSAAPLPASPPMVPISPPAVATTPRQRDTIRFTGVVNFGNGSNVLSHLQQFESIFHGSSTPAPAAASSMIPPTRVTPSPGWISPVGVRTPLGTPILTPFLVRIPLPLPSANLKLAYPNDRDPIPIPTTDGTSYRKTTEVQNFSLQSKNLLNGKNVMQPPRIINPQVSISEPPWKKQHEHRIAQLERTQEEHAEKLRKKEYARSPGKDINDSTENSEESYSNQRTEAVNHDRNGDCDCERKSGDSHKSNPSSHEEEHSTEEDNSSEKTSESGNERGNQQFQNNNANGIHKPYKFGQPHTQQITVNNYTDIQDDHQLPISDYYDKNRPDQIRNSYGEVLDDDYFDKLANLEGKHENSEQSDKDYTSMEEGEEGSSAKESGDEDPVVKLRQEYGLNQPENKYEEYTLNENYNEDRSNLKMTRTPNTRIPQGATYNTIPIRPLKSPNNFQSIDTLRSNTEAEKLNQNLDFLKYTPYIAPVQYLYQPNVMDNRDRKQSSFGSVNNLNHGFNKLSPTQSTGTLGTVPKLEDLTFKIGLPPPTLPRKLHEGEEKQQQIWPAPFDVAYDSTETKALSADPQFPLDFQSRNVYQASGSSGKQYDASIGSTRASNPQQYRDAANGYDYSTDTSDSLESMMHLPQGTNSPSRDMVILRFGQSPNKDTSADSNSSTEQVLGILNRYRHGTIEGGTGKTNVKLNTSIPKAVQNLSIFSDRPSTVNVYKVPSRKVIRSRVKRSNSKSIHNKQHSKPHQKIKLGQNNQTSKARTKISTPQRSFYDPRSAHDFFGFSKNDYSFDNQEKTVGSSSPSTPKISQEEREAQGFIIPEPAPYQYDESIPNYTDKSDSEPRNVRVKEYSNKLATLKVHQQKQDSPNGPVRYIDFTRNL